MDTARAVAITEFTSKPSGEQLKKYYESFNDKLDVLPSTATATEAIVELAQGKFLSYYQI